MNPTVREIVAAILNLTLDQIVLYEVGGWLETSRTTDPELDDLQVPTTTGSIYVVLAIKANGRTGREFRIDVTAAEIAAI